MDEQFVTLFTYFVLAVFIGFEIISKVPSSAAGRRGSRGRDRRCVEGPLGSRRNSG